MKYLVCLIGLLLTGCSALDNASHMGKNKLDVAPQFDYEVRHPEWGRVANVVSNDQKAFRNIANMPVPSTAKTKYTSKPQAKPEFKTDYVKSNSKFQGSSKSLMDYFAKNNIRYEVIPGEHTMIRLLQPIYFQLGSMNMTDKSRDFLDNIARYLTNYQGVDMVVEGHADNTGTAVFNDALSLKRAEAVKQWILSRFSHLENIYTRGYGSAMPACDNKTPKGKACNRRVEVFFILPS